MKKKYGEEEKKKKVDKMRGKQNEEKRCKNKLRELR